MITRGIFYIKQEQLPDGSFLSLSSVVENDFSSATTYSTTFFTATILSCLTSFATISSLSPETREILSEVRKRGAQFLLSQKSGQWSFNYWAREAKERNTMPYPDDLDDTFAALAALAQYDRETINGPVLASIVKILTATEVREGGPYRTWLVPPDSATVWLDVDLVVNSTIGYFLSLLDVRLPKLERFVEDAIRESHITSPYYPDMCQVAYFISRFYRGNEKERFVNMLVAHLKIHGTEITPLECAMSITALVNLGFVKKIASNDISFLEESIKRDGLRPYAFCIDPARNKQKSYAGSSALTAAFCIEALAKYFEASRTEVLNVNSSLEHTSTHEHIRDIARSECLGVPQELRSIALKQIDKMSDPKITALSYEFKNSLGKKGESVPVQIVESLALGSLYGWMAYTIYDDFLDDESDPILLSSANFFLRRLVNIYKALDNNIPGSWGVFMSVMDVIDNANTWEQVHCRIPLEQRNYLPDHVPSFGSYENLADRSFGHALGSLTELFSIGYTEDSEEYKALAFLLRHYLIARQLHDDAHDWAEDLMSGRINSVAALLIPRWKNAPANENQSDSLANLLPHLRKFFWTTIIDEVVDAISKQIAAAREAREKSDLLRKSFFMENYLTALERTAQGTLEERDKMLRFLESYKLETL